MRHHFHRCPNLRVVTADASDLHGARRSGSMALDELCLAKDLTSCVGLVECDVLVPAQKRTLLVARATRLREEDGHASVLSGAANGAGHWLSELRRDLLQDRERIVAGNRRLELEIAELQGVGRDGGADEADRGDAAAELLFDDALEKLQVRRLDAIDRALEAMERGSFGRCTGCDGAIDANRLRALPDATLCIDCARAAEAQ